MQMLTTRELAEELHTDTRVVRVFLREVTPKEAQPGLGGRWAVPASKTTMRKLRRQYEMWSEGHSGLIRKHAS